MPWLNTPLTRGGMDLYHSSMKEKLSIQTSVAEVSAKDLRVHSRFMRLALDEAKKAAAEDEVPVGAVVVHNGKVLAADHNRICTRRDPTAHAEVLAIRAAARRLKNERLCDTILYTTIEPCSMCAGALVLARVSLVVYGASDLKAGAGGSLLNILQHPQLNHRTDVLGGILERPAARLLRSFFRKKRRSR
jgi:tRNA(adenine34) deaminase